MVGEGPVCPQLEALLSLLSCCGPWQRSGAHCTENRLEPGGGGEVSAVHFFYSQETRGWASVGPLSRNCAPFGHHGLLHVYQ